MKKFGSRSELCGWPCLPNGWSPNPPLPSTPSCDTDENTCGKLCSYTHIALRLSSPLSSQFWLQVWMKSSGAAVLSSPSLYLSFSPYFEILLHTMPTKSPQSWNACCHLDYAREAEFLLKTFLPSFSFLPLPRCCWQLRIYIRRKAYKMYAAKQWSCKALHVHKYLQLCTASDLQETTYGYWNQKTWNPCY